MTTRRGRRSNRFTARAPRRKTQWFTERINLTLASGAGDQQVHDLSQSVDDDHKVGATVVRTILDFGAILQSIGTGAILTIGIAFVSDDAVVANAFPDPDIDFEPVSWLYRTMRGISLSTANNQAEVSYFREDLKGKRRFQMGENNLYLIANIGVSAQSLNLDGLVRILVMYR